MEKDKKKKLVVNFSILTILIILFILINFNLYQPVINNDQNSKRVLNNEDYRCFDCNVILVVIDALRYDHLGCYGYEKNTSPNIDKICEKGVVFENAISQATWTKPAMTSLFTSNYVKDHNITFFTTNYTEIDINNVLPLSAITFAEILSLKGYKTKAIVGNPFIKKGFGLEQGFNEYDFFFDNDQTITVEALEWINKNKDNKFFLYIHYMAPHADYNPPSTFKEKFKPYYKGNINFKGKHQDYFNNITLSKEDLEELVARYDGKINYIDNELGKILKYLQDENVTNKTILIVTADHGEALREKKLVGHGYLLNTVIQVPLIILTSKYSPKRIEGVVELIDVSPSILYELGIGIPDTFKGINLFQFQNGISVREFGFSQDKPYLGIRSEHYFFKTNFSNNFLYDLIVDPFELEDIKESNPAIFKKFLDISTSFNSKTDKQEMNIKKINKKTIEELTALGYLT